jgi:hypothetical protein
MAKTHLAPDTPNSLTPDLLADIEGEEGPALGTHTGQNRTVIPEHATVHFQGPKTLKANKDRVSRRS